MSRPLLISDCDEVLLHMLRHFADWIGERHGFDLALHATSFRDAVRDRATGGPVAEERIWPLLDGFFDSEMHRQNVVPGAVEALRAIAEPKSAVHMPPAPHAHARIDEWDEARGWILGRFEEGQAEA